MIISDRAQHVVCNLLSNLESGSKWQIVTDDNGLELLNVILLLDSIEQKVDQNFKGQYLLTNE